METPKYLYHYTSQKGLFGILKTKKLWMTNIYYLNDSSELIYTIKLVRSELIKRQKLLTGKGLRAIVKEDDLNIDEIKFRMYDIINSVLDDFLHKMIIENYVFSLSEKGNDLNQWRGYCPKEGGFCIEFDYHKLLSIIEKNKKNKIKECIYDKKIQNESVKLLFDETLKLVESKEGDRLNKISNLILNTTVNMSSYFKDESFSDELETRIISSGSDDEKKYLEGKSILIPYIEFSIEDNNGRLPISKIIVGPTQHQELSKSSIDHLLHSWKYEIDVEQSNIPYRSL
jgi:hypothetical protein